ncbi:serine/threonine-protein phosphatase 4 regulatory subunit 3 [Planococcus citri]|uniref:serine/threonine-protein phosphatase 4 regulatory subunit 3 n=1 Tax=Planococcus citri TaxID=170843 RepID=UPI0031F8DB26
MTDTRDIRRRVKLYALNAERQWDDRGTGHVSSTYLDRHKGVSLLVRAETDGSLLLESKIQPDTAYQKQQDTLIVWSEGDNFDLALSFQEKVGCDEIWEKICQVQGKDPSVEVTQDIIEESEDERFDDMSDTTPPIELPPCEIGHLEEIKELTVSCLTSAVRKEKLTEAIENDSYIRKLLNLFRICEDLNNVEGLHYLFDIFRNIFLLNKNALFEVLFSDELIFDVIGCLEYDPLSPEPKRHRQYLKYESKFKEVVSISNPELLAKIHQTHRVQYIQDVVLPAPSMFEDNMLSALSSFIFFNKVEIVTMIQEDEKFLPDLLSKLTDESTPDVKRRDLILFLREYCNFSQTLQPQGKESFYKTLSSLGILSALEITLSCDDPQTKNASLDVLTYITEFSPSVVREYTLSQVNNTDDHDSMLVNVIIEQLICDNDPELARAVQLMSNLRILIDPETMLHMINKSEKTEFLSYFYKHSIQLLIAPLLANTLFDFPIRDDYATVQLLALILELLTFCVEHHTYQIKNIILSKDLLRRVLILMNSKHKFLVLYALRFMRKIIGLKDEFYYRYIIKGELFKPVIDSFLNNKGRYNLLDSAILEMFEFIKVEDIKPLYTHIIETYGKRLEAVDYVQTFKSLKVKYNQHMERIKDRDKNNTSLDSVPSIMRANRYRRDQRQLDEEEEMWFNEDDDFDEGEAVVPATNSSLINKKLNSELEAIGKSIDKKAEANNAARIFTNNAKNSSAINNNLAATGALSVTQVDNKCSVNLFKKALVDYEGDSDDEEDDENDLLNAKRARFT